MPSAIINGDLTVTRTSGVTTVLVETTDANSYSDVTVQANTSSNISLVAFGATGGVGTLYDNNTAYVSATADKTGIINESATGVIVFATGGYGQPHEAMRIVSNGQIMIEGNCVTHPQTPSAYLTIAASNGAGKGSLKILPSTLLVTPEPYLFECDTNGDLYWTNTAGTRTKLN